MSAPEEVKRPLWVSMTRSPVAVIGVALTTFSALLFLIVVALQQLGFRGGLYLGIVAFLILPALFAVGLLLIPLGIWARRRKERRHRAAGITPTGALIFNFNVARTRNIAALVLVFTALNVVILTGGIYKGVQVMESAQFCGGACHSVMSPEFTAYQRSPHSRVSCTECHVGSGADWFVRSKVSGARQLVELALGRYPRPIVTPVHNMRPAGETCEQCHAPGRFVGERLAIHSHFSPDEKQTEKKTVVLLKVGGLQDEKWQGIHRHVDPRRAIRFRSDASRQRISEVELSENGITQLFQVGGKSSSGAWRAMDCTDCHNRPAHSYSLANDELDTALETRRIDRTLPFIKREGLSRLEAAYASSAEAAAGIRRGVLAFYEKQYPQIATANAAQVSGAAEVLVGVYQRNVFPEMKIGWGTYPTFAGHAGCFRCHDNEHVSAKGEKISKSCELCHTAIATDEVDPEILQVLHP